MSDKACGCSTETCGCCEGIRRLTPLPTANRPGLDALRYRVGTHGAFLETMKARLSSVTVEGPGEDGQTLETFRPLVGLTSRDEADPAIALLDACATVEDVLTFYQERIANEGFLRTATERRSVLELARLLGYELRPGVAATAYLAYTLDDTQVEPVEIPVGARSQTIPGPGELPQSFETSESLMARSAWNNLQVRLGRPQNITLENAMTIAELYVEGTATNLKAGDFILLVFGEDGSSSVLRTVAEVKADFTENRTKLALLPVPPLVLAVLTVLDELLASAAAQNPEAGETPESKLAPLAEQIRAQILLGSWPFLVAWAEALKKPVDSGGTEDPPDPEDDEMLVKIRERLKLFIEEVRKILATKDSASSGSVTTDPSKFVRELLKEPIAQAANSLQLSRSPVASFAKGSDAHSQLLINLAPRLKDTYYKAWSNANVNPTPPQLKGVFTLSVVAPLFGSGAAKLPTYYTDTKDGHEKGQITPQSQWEDWGLVTDEIEDALYLDSAHEEISADSYLLIHTQIYIQEQEKKVVTRQVRRVSTAQTLQRTAYGLSGKTTQLSFEEDWWKSASDSDGAPLGDLLAQDSGAGALPAFEMATLRGTLVYAQGAELTLSEAPMADEVSGQSIELGMLHQELASGRWVIFSGERTDIPGVSGVTASELLMVSGLDHGYDQQLPSDKTHTTLLLATQTAFRYKRESLKIYGNVVKATHGETREERLGSGDAGLALQSFTLKQPPLTFVAAPTAAGVESTLKVYVDEVEWKETDTLVGLKGRDRRFVTKTDDDGKTTVTFGDGRHGARPPTGIENLRAKYRNGIGKAGNVLAEQVSLLQTRPLGVKGVINPLRASGGADKDNLAQARDNTPLAVMALDRLVSVQDYADFTRTFAGIGKAAARRLSDGRREVVHVTIAGVDDAPIDPVSDLYRNLPLALRKFGETGPPVQVDSRELKLLVLSASIRLAPDYLWESVAQKVRGRILDAFGFQKRNLGQAALLCEVISVMQNTRGVAYVDVDVFGGIDEKLTDSSGARQLQSLEQLEAAAQAIVSSGTAQRVEANLADFESGTLRPAQLVVFTPAIPETLILNQIV